MKAALLATMFVVLGAAPAWAQGNPRDFEKKGPAAERAMYYAQVRTEVNNFLIRWQRAFESDNAKELAGYYAEEATFYPAWNAPVQLRSSIRDYYTTFLRTVGSMEQRMSDFGTSGDLAYVTARVVHHVRTENGLTKPVNFIDMFVLRRKYSTGTWEIEAHLSREEALPALP